MNGYKKLNNEEIESLRRSLELPKETYPYYQPLIIDGINVIDYTDVKLLSAEEFRELRINRRDGEKKIFISNYGRVKFNNAIIKPYIIGTFLHCSKVYDKEFGDHYIYNLVKEAFDPIEDRQNYQIHHINNNALDNRPDNLIWVTEEEHRLIDSEFNKELIQLSRNIYKRNFENIINYFKRNYKRDISGNDLINYFNNTYDKVIKDNVISLCEKNIIICLRKTESFLNNRYLLNI